MRNGGGGEGRGVLPTLLPPPPDEEEQLFGAVSWFVRQTGVNKQREAARVASLTHCCQCCRCCHDATALKKASEEEEDEIKSELKTRAAE